MNSHAMLVPTWLAAGITCVASVACVASSERANVVLDRAPMPIVAPPPTPQVMIAPPAAVSTEPVVLAPISEARRREILLPSVNPIEPYTPAPLPSPPRRDVVVRYEYSRPCSNPYYGPCYDPYYGSDYDYYRGYDGVEGIARLATYTAAGAIIGHQFHERGRGAAIGAGLALLTWPFGGWWNGGWRW